MVRPSQVELYAASAETPGRACPAGNCSATRCWLARGAGCVGFGLACAEALYPAHASRLDPFKGVIDEILIADLDARVNSDTP